MAPGNVAHAISRCGRVAEKNVPGDLRRGGVPCYRDGHNKRRALPAVQKHSLKNGIVFVLRKIQIAILKRFPRTPSKVGSPGLISKILGIHGPRTFGSRIANFFKRRYLYGMATRRRGPNRKTQRNSVKASTVAEEDILNVFNHWIDVHKKDSRRKPALDDKRRFIIALAIADYGVEDCRAAIDGCSLSPFHMGRNKQGKKYNDIALILRAAEQIERFLEIYDKEFEEGDPW